MNALRAARRATSGRRSSSRRSTSTRSTTCGGCQIHVTRSRGVQAGADRRRADRRVPRAPVRTASRGASRPYEYEHDKLPIDILAGSPALRRPIDAGKKAEELVPVWERESKPFEKVRAEYLRY